jgi:hypothetical protein
MPAILPQSVSYHPTTQGLTRDRAAVVCRQLLRCKRRTESKRAVWHV